MPAARPHATAKRRKRSSKLRPATGRFAQFIGDHEPASGTLPLVHITRAYRFDELIRGNELTPRFCEVLRKKLTYFFYGRPAYRVKDGTNARLEFEWPVVLVFDPSKIGPLHAVYPFDTGAFKAGLYTGFFDKESQLEDFALEPSLEGVRRMVGAYYVNNAEYYSGASRKNVDIPLRQFEATGVHELARLPGVQNPGQGRRDERSSAIEVQTAGRVVLSSALLAILLPQPYMADKEIQAALARWTVSEIIPYNTVHNTSGELWVGHIYQLVYDLYIRRGILAP